MSLLLTSSVSIFNFEHVNAGPVWNKWLSKRDAGIYRKLFGFVNQFQTCVAFDIETNRLICKWLVSIWNATLGWNRVLGSFTIKE